MKLNGTGTMPRLLPALLLIDFGGREGGREECREGREGGRQAGRESIHQEDNP
jgi:hypothetical protein